MIGQKRTDKRTNELNNELMAKEKNKQLTNEQTLLIMLVLMNGTTMLKKKTDSAFLTYLQEIR